MTQRILFVCLGNICRSPAAQAIMDHLAELYGVADQFYFDSAAIGPWHVGQLPDSRMRKHGARRGLRFTHRGRQVSQRDFQDFDLIIGMDEENMQALQRLQPKGGHRADLRCMADFLTRHPEHKTVPDPYYGGPEGFELALDLLEDACEELLKQLMGKSRSR